MKPVEDILVLHMTLNSGILFLELEIDNLVKDGWMISEYTTDLFLLMKYLESTTSSLIPELVCNIFLNLKTVFPVDTIEY